MNNRIEEIDKNIDAIDAEKQNRIAAANNGTQTQGHSRWKKIREKLNITLIILGIIAYPVGIVFMSMAIIDWASIVSNTNLLNWLSITLLVLIFILGLIIYILAGELKSLKKSKRAKTNQHKQYIAEQEIRNQPADWSNTMMVFKAQELYNKLKVVCHPDRFINEEQKQIANDLFQQITQNKTNYNRLVELQKEAIDKLNIKA